MTLNKCLAASAVLVALLQSIPAFGAVSKRVLARTGELSPVSVATITGFAEGIGARESVAEAAPRQASVGVFTDDSISTVLVFNIENGEASKLYDSTVTLDSGDRARIQLSVAFGGDFVVSSVLLNDFVTQAYVKQDVDPYGEASGVPNVMLRGGDALPNGATFSFAEPPVARGQLIAFRSGLDGLYGADAVSGLFDAIIDPSSTYPGSASSTISSYSMPSLTSEDIGFKATGTSGESGALRWVAGSGTLSEFVPYTGSESDPLLTVVDGTTQYVYRAGASVVINDGTGPLSFVTAGTALLGGGSIDAVASVWGATSVSSDAPGGDLACVFYDARLAADPFGPSHLVRTCGPLSAGAGVSELLLSRGETVDGATIDSWIVTSEAVAGVDVVALANLTDGGRALLAIGDPPLLDLDGDGVPDTADNCKRIDNPDQRDTDADGIGNRCDPDLNNDCLVNIADLALFKARFLSTDPDADFDGSGLVNIADLAVVRDFFLAPPGPSGLADLCD